MTLADTNFGHYFSQRKNASCNIMLELYFTTRILWLFCSTGTEKVLRFSRMNMQESTWLPCWSSQGKSSVPVLNWKELVSCSHSLFCNWWTDRHTDRQTAVSYRFWAITVTSLAFVKSVSGEMGQGIYKSLIVLPLLFLTRQNKSDILRSLLMSLYLLVSSFYASLAVTGTVAWGWGIV